MSAKYCCNRTCKVLMCLSLNLSSTYRSTIDVLPTAPSPNNTILKLCVPEDELELIVFTPKYTGISTKFRPLYQNYGRMTVILASLIAML